MSERYFDYERKRRRISHEIKQLHRGIRLGKRTTNLFRERRGTRAVLDVGDFNHVLAVNPDEGWIEAEGMATYETLVDEALPHHVIPAVVPELKTITVGGAISGTGLESSSFKFGFVHETVLEMDILLPDGRIVLCTRDNEYHDLFFGIPNSYGTLGYILRAKIKAIPVLPYVHLQHIRFETPEDLFVALKERVSEATQNFLEAVAFDECTHVMTIGTFSDAAPYTSDYTYMNIYYRSLLSREEDYLMTKDYLWRWDTDWFWDSKLVGAQNPVIRFLLGRRRLNSKFYMKVLQWDRKAGFTAAIQKIFHRRRETVIQDIEIPIERAAEFLDFLHKEIGIRPLIIGPVRARYDTILFPLFPLKPQTLYVNIGFWGVVPRSHEPGYFNKLIERKARLLGGLKMLYSDSYYSEDEFREIYGGDAYEQLKQKYDPQGKLKSLYDKCVRHA